MIRPSDISVVIASRNRPDLLADAVHAVLDGSTTPAEVVVVDQSDRHNDLLGLEANDAGSPLIYRHEPGRGVSRARNTGARAAVGSHLAFIDDDVLVDPDWLADLARVLSETGGRRAISGRVRPGPQERPRAFAPSTLDDDSPRTYRPGRTSRDVLFTNNAAVPAQAFAEVGGFDETLGPGTRFPAAEDNDLGYRLLRDGWEIAYAPDVIVTHRSWRSQEAVVSIMFGYGRGQGAFYAKHIRPDRRTMAGRFAMDVARKTRRALRRAVTDHRYRLALADAAYVIGLVTGFVERSARRGPR